MTPDILFWFYKEFDLCRVRVSQLRRLNPEVRIYALYGGPIEQVSAASLALADLVDDLYVYPERREPKWKWRHGDQLIAAWHRDRGRYLNWQTISIVQWDMLVAAPQKDLFSGLVPGEILVSGLREVGDMGQWWNWTRPDNSNYLAFRKLLADQYGYHGELLACLFIVICLPRQFLERYVDAGSPLTGFLEYKIPTLATVFDIPFCTDHDFDPWWPGDPVMCDWPAERRLLAPLQQEVADEVIRLQLEKKNGGRVFHPVSRPAEDLFELGLESGLSSGPRQ